MKDTARTITVGVFGFITQLTNWDILVKFAIGLATLIYIISKTIAHIAKNWYAIRHPIRTAKNAMREAKAKARGHVLPAGPDDSETDL